MAIKQQRRYSSPELPVAIFDCQAEGCPLCLYHIYQGEYVATDEINPDGGERKSFRDCVDEIRGRGK